MSTKTTNPAVEQQLAELAEQLAAVEAERAADPLSSADDVASWQDRDADRTTRSVALASRAEILRRDGILAADPNVAAALTQYEQASARARSALRTNGISNTVGWNSPRTTLETWLRELAHLNVALPQDDNAARRRLAAAYSEFIAARTGVCEQLAAKAGHQLPQPALPDGLAHGVYPTP